MTLKHSCRWLVNKDGKNVYCEKKVQYKMVWDGDEVGSTKVRKYNPFCAEHMAKYELQEDD